ncbi:MAG: hypothetical protein FWF69_01125 [Firmicutes bacterium]|nr:hypothetical protein [Bacillota bacterium]
MCDTSRVLAALSAIRSPRLTSEYDLHALVLEALDNARLPYRHEAPVAPRCRIDFLCGGVGVEVKRGRPSPTPLLKQLAAYALSDAISALVLVAERPPRLPSAIREKPLMVVSLQRLWGIAL